MAEPDDTARHDHLAVVTQRRRDMAGQLRLVERAHAVTVLDHLAALVRDACPQAAYVAFAYYGNTRSVDLHGVLAEAPTELSPLPWLWDRQNRQTDGEDEDDGGHVLDGLADRIERDTETILRSYQSPVWSAVRRNTASEGNSWLLQLPPADRVAHIAELVRAHHPEASHIVVDGRSGGRALEVLEGPQGVEGPEGDGPVYRTVRCAWPLHTDDEIARMIAQIFALPDLADRHLEAARTTYRHPFGQHPSDSIRILPLPPTD
ncbi:hypothetical protein [Streptomyces fractus]|uniref:hypothetical protein n=1 Tax=Streptomyces fractus TaxID=641806 RepID=UPI003CEC934D